MWFQKLTCKKFATVTRHLVRCLQRFDFKGTNSSVDRRGRDQALASSSEDRLAALRVVLEEKLAKRKVSMKVLDYGTIEPASGSSVRQTVKLQAGINAEKAKELNKFIKGLGLKGVQSSTQGDSFASAARSDDLHRSLRSRKPTSASRCSSTTSRLSSCGLRVGGQHGRPSLRG